MTRHASLAAWSTSHLLTRSLRRPIPPCQSHSSLKPRRVHDLRNTRRLRHVPASSPGMPACIHPNQRIITGSFPLARLPRPLRFLPTSEPSNASLARRDQRPVRLPMADDVRRPERLDLPFEEDVIALAL